MKISERHVILYETIGYLPEEQTSYENVWIIAGVSLAFVTCGTILEAFLYMIYNERVHPFKNIIIDLRTTEKLTVQNISMNDLKCSSPDNVRKKENTTCAFNTREMVADLGTLVVLSLILLCFFISRSTLL